MLILFIQKSIAMMALAFILVFGLGGMVNAQSTTTISTTTNQTSTTVPPFPSAPNTGMGGTASTNVLVLTLSGLIILIGSYYLYSLRSAEEESTENKTI